jgi:hypothetical protein
MSQLTQKLREFFFILIMIKKQVFSFSFPSYRRDLGCFNCRVIHYFPKRDIKRNKEKELCSNDRHLQIEKKENKDFVFFTTMHEV